MQCDHNDVPGGKWTDRCNKPAKWWFREAQQRPWHARCGHHAMMPGNTKRERLPINKPCPPNFEPLAQGGSNG